MPRRPAPAPPLSPRERQIVEALYALGEGGAREVAERIGEPGAFDSVRVTLGVLERKGRLRHRVEGRRHIYAPVQPPEQARRAAWSSLTGTFFGGSPGKALIALLGQHGDRLDDGDLDELSRWVAEQTRRRRQR